MLNYYELLKVPQNATKAGIKKAYQKLALIMHPDKGGSKEAFLQLNKAYEVLMNDDERRQYDAVQKLFDLAEEDEIDAPYLNKKATWTPAGYLKTNRPSFSDTFKQQHASFVAQYEPGKSDKKIDFKSCIKDKEANLFADYLIKFNDNKNSNLSTNIANNKNMTLNAALSALYDFLHNAYSPSDLYRIKNRLDKTITNRANDYALKKEKSLYDGVIEIFGYCLNHTKFNDNLLSGMQKLSDYATEYAEYTDTETLSILHQLSIIFASKRYRQMYAFALQEYWTSDHSGMKNSDLQLFNGIDLANTALKTQKNNYINNKEPNTFNIIKLFVVLKKLEIDINKYPMQAESNTDKCIFYRNKGYLMLDWVPAISGLVDPKIIYNTLLQAGICFQLASKLEENLAVSFADEKLAFHIYMNACILSNKSTPDVELYANTAILKLVMQFQYVSDKKMREIISQLTRRTLKIADIYPFYLPYQSNTKLTLDEGKSIALMRKFLHSLSEEADANPSAGKIYGHELVTIWYEIYNACLQNWYEKQISPDVENSFRYKLMKELLRINRWTFADVNRLIIPSEITLTRDSEGWISSTRTISFNNIDHSTYLSTVSCLEIDFDAGSIKIGCEEKKSFEGDYKNLFTTSDVEEIFNKRITSAIFSLDQIDPDMPHHPYNKIWFMPNHLYQSQLLHCMALADLRLKYLTVGKEVQGVEPYAMRSLDVMLNPLPAHLKRIILDYQNSAKEGKIHRFWIEAEELPVATRTNENGNKLSMVFHPLRMIVKKHAMLRNVNGDLIDTDRDDEGWDIIVDSSDQYRYDRPTMVWNTNTFEVVFYKDNERSQSVVINEPRHQLKKLFKLSRDSKGKVTPKNSNEAYTLYSLTKIIAAKTNLPHYFSPEYTFSQELSHHYNDFAMYFPELGRLRELSKIVMITRILSNQRDANLDRIKKVLSKKYDDSHWNDFYQQAMPEIINSVSELLNKYKELTNYLSLSLLTEQNLSNLRNVLGVIDTSTYNYVLSHLHTVFSGILKHYDYTTVDNALKCFINYQHDHLRDILVATKKQHIIEDIQLNVFKDQSKSLIESAMDGNVQAIVSIAHNIANKQINNAKLSLQSKLDIFNKLEQTFKQMGLSNDIPEVNLERLCLWVPASVNHAHDNHPHTIYGGVHISGQVCQINNNPTLNDASMHQVQTNALLYRLWGGEAMPIGHCWSPVNPLSVSNFRDTAGLPNSNTATGLIVARLTSPAGAPMASALPCDGNQGRGPMIYLENPTQQIQLVFASYGPTPLV